MACQDNDLPPPLPFKRQIVVAAAALYDADGRILLTEHLKAPWQGYWEFPGGRVEDRELPDVALIRELKEELGITACRPCLQPLSFISHVYENLEHNGPAVDGGNLHVLMVVYAVRQWQGTPTGLEGQKVAWVRPNELEDWKLLPADVPLISALL